MDNELSRDSHSESKSDTSDTQSKDNASDSVPLSEVIPNGVTPVIHNISPRILSGVLSESNQNAIDWSCNGFLAFACHNRVIITQTKQQSRVTQSLHRHNCPISKIKWKPDSELKLVSADINGTIIIWDVTDASVMTLIAGEKDTKVIIAMEWVQMNAIHSKQCKEWFLIVNYGSNNLILYDTYNGDIVWRKNFPNINLRMFSLDPFASNALFSIESNSNCSFGIIDDLNSQKSPNGNVKRYQINLKGSESNSSKSPTGRLKYTLQLMGSDTSEESINFLTDYIQVSYHRSVRDQIFVVFNREILLIDLSIEMIICTIPLERSSSNLVHVYSCSYRNVFLTLHDGGSVSLRLFQKKMISEKNSDTNVMHINYVMLCQSENLRLIKQNKLFGFCVSPLDETKVILLLSNGRLVMNSLRKMNYDSKEKVIPFLNDLISIDEYHLGNVKKGKDYRLIMTHVIPSVSSSPHVIRMCPPVTLRNWPLHKPFLAIGDSSGTIQIWNLSSSLLEKELSIHSSPVRGIEWTNLGTFLSFAYPNLSHHNGRVNNELNITQIISGRTYPLRVDRNADSSPIEMLRVSHLKQYFIISFKDDPFEIWDLTTLALLRLLPKKFAAVVAIEWSPLYNKRIDNKSESYSPPLQSRENFVVTNTNGELFHFSIEGTIIKEISCIPPDTAMSGNITFVSWKSDHVLLGDADGNVNIWDLKKKISKVESTHRGWIKKIRFGPGRGNMKILILYNDGVDIYDVKDFKLYSQLKSPRDINFKIQDIDWAGSDRPILASSDGTIFITDLKLKHFTSPIFELNDSELNGENISINSNFHIFTQMTQFIFKSKLFLNQLDDGPQMPEDDIKRYILVAKLFGDSESVKFWTVVNHVINNIKFDTNYDICLDNESYKELQLEKVALIESNKSSYKHIKKCCEWHLLLGNKHRAVQILLESDQNSYVDALKACLVASLQTNSDDLLTTAHPIIKLVATNLIANGRVEEGTQLLCLIGKTQDACRYLQSANKWNDAFWLAKCTLNGDEYTEVMRRWSDHLIAHNDINSAIMVLLSSKQFTKVIQLINKYDNENAILLLDFCIKNNFIINDSVIIEEVIYKYTAKLKDAGLEHAVQYYTKLLK